MDDEVRLEYAVRWESGEQVGPIGPNEAADLVRDQNPGNPKVKLVRTVTYSPWKEER